MEVFSASNPHRNELIWLAYYGDEVSFSDIARAAGLSRSRAREIVDKIDRRIEIAGDRWLRSRTPYGVFPLCCVGCDCPEHPVAEPPPVRGFLGDWWQRRPTYVVTDDGLRRVR